MTYDQFEEALGDLEAQGMQGLVIDLRGNPGGSLTTVTDMLKLLLPEGTIVSTKDKYGNTEEITCDGSHEFTKPLAVLCESVQCKCLGNIQRSHTGLRYGNDRGDDNLR